MEFTAKPTCQSACDESGTLLGTLQGYVVFHPVAKKADLDLSVAAAQRIADVVGVFDGHTVELEDDVSGLKLEVLGEAAGLDADDLEALIVGARSDSEALAKP